MNILKRLFGGSKKPTWEGKTGNTWTSADFPDSDSDLIQKGVDELVDVIAETGICDMREERAEKLREIVSKYRAPDLDEYRHFSVLVKERLIGKGILSPDDPTRFRSSIDQLAVIFHDKHE